VLSGLIVKLGSVAYPYVTPAPPSTLAIYAAS
jgi:hypothetical protein